jgi:hypothetical protein
MGRALFRRLLAADGNWPICWHWLLAYLRLLRRLPSTPWVYGGWLRNRSQRPRHLRFVSLFPVHIGRQRRKRCESDAILRLHTCNASTGGAMERAVAHFPDGLESERCNYTRTWRCSLSLCRRSMAPPTLRCKRPSEPERSRWSGRAWGARRRGGQGWLTELRAPGKS